MRPTPRASLLLLPAFLSACHMGGASRPYTTAGAVAAYDVTGAESYAPIAENQMVAVADAPRSTFAIDVDTASMSNVRRFLEDGQLPPADAVRVEEMINYFDYAYPDPDAGPFTVVTEVGPSPFHAGRTLLHIGLQGRRMEEQELPPRNLVFLIDTSGSMMSADKLPLVKQSLGLLVEQLDARDRVGIVAYAGGVGVVLEPTTGDQKDTILGAIANLEAGGSTAGAAGIQAAYALAHEHFDRAAINRVILVTDGDFNVGVSDEGELVKMIEKQRDGGVALTVLGFGTGNLQDSRMEKLADHGNGNYGYIDDLAEAKKMLVEEAGGTLVTIAKDVKIQVELDPAQVESYRLVGYENRMMANEDFRNDARDAGELGAGHSVTAIYELVPAKTATRGAAVATVRLRWLPPPGDQRRGEASELVTEAVDAGAALASTTHDFRFAAAVAGFGMLLRQSEHAGETSWVAMRDLALGAADADPSGRRLQLAALIETAARLSGADLGPSVAR